MNTVAVVGVGLIGGSFGLALRSAGFSGEILGVSSRSAIEEGLKARAIDQGVRLEEAAARADLIYLSQPVDRILETIPQLKRLTKPECLITDAGSTKQLIVGKAVSSGLSDRFLGGHPLAGKEERGAQAADGNLFRDRPYILTPLRQTPASDEFRTLLVRMGARVYDMSAEEHDRTVALTSHLPQVMATALALTLSRNRRSRVAEIFGPGLLEMTRLAMSAPELWKPILSTNRPAVAAALDEFCASIKQVQDAIGRNELDELFHAGGNWAKTIRGSDKN